MLDSGSSEGGNPQLYQALQAQKAAASSHGGGTGGGQPGVSGLGGHLPTGFPGGHGLPGVGNSTPQRPAPPPPPPREVGSLGEELVQRPLADIATEVKSWFDINKLFEINPAVDTPEEQQRKQAFHARYQKLTAEQQQRVQKRYQEEMQRKQRMLEEDQRAAQKKQAEEANSIAMPSSPQKGAANPNAKQGAAQRLKNDRLSGNLNKPQSAG